MTIDRWILRKQRKLMVVGSAFLTCLLIYTVTYHENIQIEEKHFQPFSERCRTGSGSDIISDVCRNYTVGAAYGLLCEDLCQHKTILIEDCIHHGSTYVLLGENTRNGDKVVLKRKKYQDLSFAKGFFEEYLLLHHDINQVRDYFLTTLADEIQSSHGHDSKVFFLQNVASVSRNIFGKNISKLTVPEMQNSWKLIGQDELIVLALHQNMRAFPKLKGTCGTIYALERITPYSKTFPEFIPSLSWYKRVRIALSFLELIKQFYSSDVGPLHHCDIQEGNFGLTEDLTVKVIDADLINSVNRIDEILPQPKCSSDDDCDFFDCHSQCDKVAGQCTTKQITNNLQVVCRDIFRTQWSGLLANFQPSHVKTKLNSILKDCESRSFGLYAMNHSIVWNMITQKTNYEQNGTDCINMVQLLVKLAEKHEEWSIIELQGFLESDQDELAGLHIGDLHFDEKGTPNLLIGHHVLAGKVSALDKPFGVLHKKKYPVVAPEELMDVDSTPGISYDIVAFVKQKIIFKNRPRPIIIKTQAIKT